MTPFPANLSWARWQTYSAVVNDVDGDLVALLPNALRSLVDLWPALGGAIRYYQPNAAPIGIRQGALSVAAQRVIARHLFVAEQTTVHVYQIEGATLLAAPLHMHSVTVGGLYLLVDGAVSDPAELGLAANLLDAALGRLATLNDLRRDLRELGLIANITRTLNASLDLQLLLRGLIDDARALLAAEAARVSLVDVQRHELVFEVEDDRDEPTYARIPISDDLASIVVNDGEAIVVEDVARDGRDAQGPDDRWGLRLRTVLAVPLHGRNGVIGVLEVVNRRDGQPFDSHDVELATLLANQAAVSVENARLVAELRAERDRLIRREADVRAQVGRDLHDGPVQQVAAAGMHVKYLRTVAARAPAQLPTVLDDLETQLQQATHDLRTVLYELRPLGIEEEGLYVVLERYVAKFRDPHGLQVQLAIPPELRRLPPAREAPTLIIIQEAINNVRKHAQARDVYITLCEEAATLIVTIQDNGRGFDVQALEAGYIRRGSFGLLNMRERAELIGGTWQIESEPGVGTIVTVRIPFE